MELLLAIAGAVLFTYLVDRARRVKPLERRVDALARLVQPVVLRDGAERLEAAKADLGLVKPAPQENWEPATHSGKTND